MSQEFDCGVAQVPWSRLFIGRRGGVLLSWTAGQKLIVRFRASRDSNHTSERKEKSNNSSLNWDKRRFSPELELKEKSFLPASRAHVCKYFMWDIKTGFVTMATESSASSDDITEL
ncbi:hypothetical protein CEXT_810861 [Caerostris extrusa]|uniref:Uncharacterized protein n=1 Tax=Caerostris extrusa TaxID=172846 RepID=A0AAV4MBH6_CAEEX|nr:hypothetical protein CEXT_810861 [Caerostris extrusa]